LRLIAPPVYFAAPPISSLQYVSWHLRLRNIVFLSPMFPVFFLSSLFFWFHIPPPPPPPLLFSSDPPSLCFFLLELPIPVYHGGVFPKTPIHSAPAAYSTPPLFALASKIFGLTSPQMERCCVTPFYPPCPFPNFLTAICIAPTVSPPPKDQFHHFIHLFKHTLYVCVWTFFLENTCTPLLLPPPLPFPVFLPPRGDRKSCESTGSPSPHPSLGGIGEKLKTCSPFSREGLLR